MSSIGSHLPLNNELFFKYFVCNAFSKASKELLSAKDRLRARVAAIAFGIFTLGFGTAVCRLYYYDRKTISPANLLKMQKNYMAKQFVGSDEKKIKLINGLCTHASKFSLLKFKQQYDILRNISVEEKFGDFCIRNKNHLRSFLLPYICAFEVLEHLINSDAENRHAEIRRLETHLIQKRHIHIYHKCLLDTLYNEGYKKQLAEKILFGNELREDFLEALYLRGLDFPTFKSIYSEVKEISTNLRLPNIFLTHEVNLNKKMRILAFAYEMLVSMENPNYIAHFTYLAEKVLVSVSYNELEFLRQYLTPFIPSHKINKLITLLHFKKREKELEHGVNKPPSIAKREAETNPLEKTDSFFGFLRNTFSNFF